MECKRRLGLMLVLGEIPLAASYLYFINFLFFLLLFLFLADSRGCQDPPHVQLLASRRLPGWLRRLSLVRDNKPRQGGFTDRHYYGANTSRSGRLSSPEFPTSFSFFSISPSSRPFKVFFCLPFLACLRMPSCCPRALSRNQESRIMSILPLD